MKSFVKEFDVVLPFPEDDVIEIARNFFLVTPDHKQIAKRIKRDIFAAGLPLGERRKNEFIPSLVLLDVISKLTKQTAIINEKAEWLFICGRDVFKEGVISCNAEPGQLVIVKNSRDECLGYGQVVRKHKIQIINMLDRGDFLRRERRK